MRLECPCGAVIDGEITEGMFGKTASAILFEKWESTHRDCRYENPKTWASGSTAAPIREDGAQATGEGSGSAKQQDTNPAASVYPGTVERENG